MRLAQQLYEGIEVDGAPVGLITYMRTDSTQVAPEAQQEARAYIGERYGADYVPGQAPQYRTKSALAQEAHEAIRPTSVLRTPEAMRAVLDTAAGAAVRTDLATLCGQPDGPRGVRDDAVDVVAGRRLSLSRHGPAPGLSRLSGRLPRRGEDDQEETRTLPPLVKGELRRSAPATARAALYPAAAALTPRRR